MQGRISTALAGLALAIGGGIAGAAVVANTSDDDRFAAGAPAAERGAADSIKTAKVRVGHALSVAQRARRIARRARGKANEGLATAVALLDEVDKALADSLTALTTAQQASTDATTALNRADNAQSQLESTRIVSDTQNGLVQTGSETDYVALGGPQVSVTVPSSGLIEIWATVTFGDDGNSSVAADGAVALYQDSQRVTQIDEENLCQSFTGSPLQNMLLTTSGPPGAEIGLSTPGAPEVFAGGCGSIGSTPGSIVLEVPPGQHTYELRYGDCGCEVEPSGFKERVLRVAPRL